MHALALSAGSLRFALPVRAVAKVLPRTRLKPVPLAPPTVAGLLPYRGTLTPVVDLCRLTLGRDAQPRRATRIVVVDVGTERLVGLLAEAVLDLIEIQTTVPGLRLPEHPWLGDHLGAQVDAPQLLDPAQLLPETLARLFVPAGGASESVT